MGKDAFVQTAKLVLFSHGPFSQWHPSVFKHEGLEFNCCEQWMMYQKARLFGDEASQAKVMASKSPREQKALGRKVSPFRPREWEAACDAIVFEGNWLKFTQNGELGERLLATEERLLAEASPWDQVWGIGLGAWHKDAQEPSKWKGSNRLGKALMRVREKLRQIKQGRRREEQGGKGGASAGGKRKGTEEEEEKGKKEKGSEEEEGGVGERKARVEAEDEEGGKKSAGKRMKRCNATA